MVSGTTADEGIKAKTHVSCSIVVQLSIVGALFVSLVLLYGFTYFSLRCQLEQLRTDVDELKAVHSLTLKPAAAAGFLGDDRNGESSSVELRRRRRSEIQQATNESAAYNDTTDQAEGEDDSSGEVTDQEYRGIWMGTYSRVPVSKYFVINNIISYSCYALLFIICLQPIY